MFSYHDFSNTAHHFNYTEEFWTNEVRVMVTLQLSTIFLTPQKTCKSNKNLYKNCQKGLQRKYNGRLQAQEQKTTQATDQSQQKHSLKSPTTQRSAPKNPETRR